MADTNDRDISERAAVLLSVMVISDSHVKLLQAQRELREYIRRLEVRVALADDAAFNFAVSEARNDANSFEDGERLMRQYYKLTQRDGIGLTGEEHD